MSKLSGLPPLRFQPLWNQLQERLQSVSEPENSIWLRVLVQALVIVGIIATDVAAETNLSFWAVPFSIVGGVWSWYRRRYANIPMKFLIAIGMLLALGTFFRNLLGQLNDTRIVLAELLITLQVWHSFDLPRRKDLGYSMVIGLILLGVAATVSQTLAFAPLLLLFLALALPTLVLDYRSRLNLQTHIQIVNQNRNKRKIKDFFPFSLKRLGALLLVTLSLGLTIFAVLPRFPGYKLQTFPVSAPNNFQEQVNNGNIINPGYVRGSKNLNQKGSGTGQNQDDGPGEMDDTFYYGFNSKMNLNLRGEMKPKLVMRVRSQAKGFWWVLGFDRYTGQGWEISRDKETREVKRPWWTYQYNLYPTAYLNRTQDVIQSFSLTADLPNLIPALSQPKSIFFPTEKISIDKEGSLRAPANSLPDGLTYSVISEVPFRDRQLLGKSPTKYPKNIENYYLQVPPEIKAKIKKFTEEVIANYNQQQIGKSQKTLDNNYEKALYLADYLKKNPIYKIEKATPFLAEKEDIVEAFLFGYKNSPPNQKITGGYPDHFSTVLTIMLRSIGIPARLVAGFAPGQFNPFTGYYEVYNTDAYSITEVYFQKYGWFTFDPVPGHDLIPPSFEDYESFSVIKEFWKWIAGWFPSPVTSLIGAIFAAILGFITWLFALFTEGWSGIFTGLLVIIGLSFIGWLIWQGWLLWRENRRLAKLPPMESLYQQMLNWLANQGFRKHPAQTPLEYSRSFSQYYGDNSARIVEDISHAYMRWRYGGKEVNLLEMRSQLRNLIKMKIKKRG